MLYKYPIFYWVFDMGSLRQCLALRYGVWGVPIFVTGFFGQCPLKLKNFVVIQVNETTTEAIKLKKVSQFQREQQSKSRRSARCPRNENRMLERSRNKSVPEEGCV